ncbi:hypothetical protein Sste5346_006920 [Sporothrix stenoceras]|uniref:Methyltransferase domain-containing protein n=1 Tax=Sporothrix stenoceras TaxID=5173 RepID=A0ABR3YXR4_9PEZI
MASFAPPRADSTIAQKWFEESTSVDGEFRDLLENYSHVSSDSVVPHVVNTRNAAWQIHPYPCLGQFRFLELNLSHRDLYSRLLDDLKTQPDARFLDIGCCLGQDLRKLIYDGAPPERVAGAELNGAFIDLGYELFKDKKALAGKTPIVSANILEDPSSPSSPLYSLAGTFSAVQLGMLLHLFTWEEQITAFRYTLSLLRGNTGDRIFGQATGHLDGTPTASVSARATFKHNADTFTKLVTEFGQTTNTSWKIVTAELDNGLSVFDGKRTWDDPRTRRLVFEIERES